MNISTTRYQRWSHDTKDQIRSVPLSSSWSQGAAKNRCSSWQIEGMILRGACCKIRQSNTCRQNSLLNNKSSNVIGTKVGSSKGLHIILQLPDASVVLYTFPHARSDTTTLLRTVPNTCIPCYWLKNIIKKPAGLAHYWFFLVSAI